MCVANGLKCTDMCKLKDCENTVPAEHAADEEDDVDGNLTDAEEDEIDTEDADNYDN